MSELILVTGGVRSGKSTYAQKLAGSFNSEVIYVATAEGRDTAMKNRISAHKRSRSKDWLTIEEPIEVLKQVKRLSCGKKVVLLDCLTLFISNLIFKGLNDAAICAEIKSIANALKRKTRAAIVVTNEVGCGIVPSNKLARRFRDLQGRVNQIAAGEADSVYLLVSGIAVKIK